MSESPNREATNTAKAVDGKNSFTGAAIKGSSLLNTVGDIRSFVQRGSTILINNVAYEIATAGEWNSSSVQLTTDYTGETNFSVNIFIPAGSFSPKRKKAPGVANGKDVNMLQMVQGLDSITEMFGAKLKQQDAAQQSQSGTVNRKSQRVVTKPAQAPPAVDESARNFAANPAKRNLPKKLPPLPSSSVTENSVDDEVDDDSIDAGRDKEVRKVAPAPVAAPATVKTRPAPKPQQTALRPSSGKESIPDNKPQSRLPSKPKEKPQPPVLPLPIKESAKQAKSRQTEAPPVDASNPLAAIVPEASLKSVEEERRAALQRVRQKNKEDQLLQEKAAAAKEQELKALKEASANKTKELQARTALRVEQYLAEKQRKLEQQKDLERYEEEQRQLKNQQFLNPSRHMKMKQIRKESNRRLQQLAYVDLVQAQVAEEHVQKSLFEHHKKYDVNTTFLPRLDGALAQGSTASSAGTAGTGQDSGVRVVKSIASELEQFEMNSHRFPEEPVLRSRSAKQPKRPGEAPRAGSLPVIAGAQKNSIYSEPVVRTGSKKHITPQAKAPPRDEDEWSDDEPDPIQEAAMHAQANRRNDDGLDEDSLNFGDEEEDEGAVLERQIFGQVPVYAPSTLPMQTAVSHQKILGAPSSQGPSKPPIGKTKSARNRRDVDDNASDCSDITIDSMLGGRQQPPPQPKGRVKTPVKSVLKNGMSNNSPSGVLPSVHAAPSVSVRPSPYLPQQFGMSTPAPLPGQVQPQQQVTFAPRAPVGQVYQPQASNASSPSVSPVKPKSKNVFRKLKPIPISSQYQHVASTNY